MEKEVKKLKLVVGISDFRIGGAQKLMSELVRNINLEKFDVTLVTLVESGKEDSFYDTIPPQIAIRKFHFKNFYDVKSWLKLAFFLAREKPSVVCSNLFFSNTIFRLLKIFFKYNVVIIEHNVYVDKGLLHRIIDKILSQVTFRIVAVSETVLDYTAKTQFISKKKFTLISNGVDVKYFREAAQKADVNQLKSDLGFLSNDKIIITVGQLIKQKNHTLLLQAFAEFVKTNASHKLVIVGDGSKRQSLENEIKQLSLGSHVKLLGIRKDVASLYAVADFFVLPSLFEGFALVCIEAMATGLPVIATRVAGPNEYIKDCVNGYFTETNPNDLCSKMITLANQTEEARKVFTNRALETAMQYDIQKTVQSYEQLFLYAQPKISTKR